MVKLFIKVLATISMKVFSKTKKKKKKDNSIPDTNYTLW